MSAWHNEEEAHSGLFNRLSGETHTTDQIISEVCGDQELCVEGWLSAIAPMFASQAYEKTHDLGEPTTNHPTIIRKA